MWLAYVQLGLAVLLVGVAIWGVVDSFADVGGEG